MGPITIPSVMRLRERRCFFLFFALLALMLAMPFGSGSPAGRAVIGLLNVCVLVSAVAAVQRSRLALAVAAGLAFPTLAFQLLALKYGQGGYFALCWSFGGAFYAYTIGHLLHYVLNRDAMTADKLYGAVAAYVMIGLLFALLFAVLQYFYPDAYFYQGTSKTLDLAELIFFSFTVLTTAGFGDITPNITQSRFLTILEAVTGIMYVAILIARLTGVYPVHPPADAPERVPTRARKKALR